MSTSHMPRRVGWYHHWTPSYMPLQAALRVSIAMGGTNTPKGMVRSSESTLCPNAWVDEWGFDDGTGRVCPLCGAAPMNGHGDTSW